MSWTSSFFHQIKVLKAKFHTQKEKDIKRYVESSRYRSKFHFKIKKTTTKVFSLKN